MDPQDREPIIALALAAARADGVLSAAEEVELQGAAARLGVTNLVGLASNAPAELATLVAKLSGAEARTAAYQTAAAVCGADGPLSPAEAAFLARLASALGLDAPAAASIDAQAAAIGTALANPAAGAGPAVTATVANGQPSAVHDEFIRKQAIVTAACELLPEKLSTLVVLPLQGRMVYRIGQSYGVALDSKQIAELAAAVGLGVAGQAVERVVSRVLGGLGRSLLGGLIGGATSLASSAAVTFAATYALGHAANEYYARGRTLSKDDLRGLYARFQEDARNLFPRVQHEVEQQARTLNVSELLRGEQRAPR